MSGLLDNQTVELPCPNCRRKIEQTIGKLKLNPKLTCRACGQGFAVNANELRTATQKIEKSLSNLQRTIGRLSK